MNFEKELAELLNKYSQESGSDTPDFILAKFLNDCLTTWNHAIAARERWYDRLGSNCVSVEKEKGDAPKEN